MVYSSEKPNHCSREITQECVSWPEPTSTLLPVNALRSCMKTLLVISQRTRPVYWRRRSKAVGRLVLVLTITPRQIWDLAERKLFILLLVVINGTNSTTCIRFQVCFFGFVLLCSFLYYMTHKWNGKILFIVVYILFRSCQKDL